MDKILLEKDKTFLEKIAANPDRKLIKEHITMIAMLVSYISQYN